MANKITDVLTSTALLWAVKIKVINTLMTQIMESGGKGWLNVNQYGEFSHFI